MTHPFRDPFLREHPSTPEGSYAALTPRDGVPRWALVDRPDPYGGGLWASEGAFAYESVGQVRALASDRKTGVLSEKVAWQIVGEHLVECASILSVLASYRTLLFDQVAGLTSISPEELSRLANALFSADLLWRGYHEKARFYGQSRRALWSFHLTKNKKALAKFLSLGTDALTWALTGGKALTHGNQYRRHNILANEVLLELATYTPNIMIAGEAHASVMHMTERSMELTSKRSDGLIIMPNGSMCGLELSASVRPDIASKFVAWLEFFHRYRGNHTVIFLEAVDPSADVNYVGYARMKKAIFRAVRPYLSATYADAFTHLGVASYRRWHHNNGVDGTRLSREGAQLMVETLDGEEWKETSFSVGEHNPHASVRRGFSSTLVTPPWTRENPYPLWALTTPPYPSGLPLKPASMPRMVAPWQA